MGLETTMDHFNGAGHQTVETPSRWLDPIGVPLEDIRRRLLRLAVTLKDHLDDHALPLLQEAERQLQQRTCRIAVIGQIKAGKSTFINALMQRPGLLPTDINPWTTVVTLLHFHNDAPAPQQAAQFHFFSAEEWKDLAEGGGRLRELTQRLVPEFQPDLLRAQLEVMRKRAERRLGPKFHELLGQSHTYQHLTPELLDDYISAGDDYEDRSGTSERRHYSDVTRRAELFFNSGPFSYPVTLIDTPGTNDPFLVRDEITRRSLENPDIYVFVISARQALSGTDISMLRLLNGLHKDRIIVFINRIDQLANPLVDGPAIKASVEQRLKREFPALEIPVIIGSAWWASLSLQSEQVDFASVLQPSAIAWLREYGLPASLNVGSRTLSVVERSRVGTAMHAGSGLPAVASTITKLMQTSNGAILLRQVAAAFLEFAKSAEMSARMERTFTTELLETRRTETNAVTSRIETERQSIGQLGARAHQLRQCFEQVETQLKAIVANNAERLRADLRDMIESFAAEACGAMRQAIEQRTYGRTWSCDVMPLRQLLETEYVEGFRQIARELVEIERALQPQLKAVIEMLLPGYGSALAETGGPMVEHYPSVAPLSDTVVLDLDVSWWNMWFAARPDPIVRAHHLTALIREDFFPLADELVREAQAQFSQRIDRSLQGGLAIADSLIDTIEKRNAELLSEYETLFSAETQKSIEQFEAEQKAHVIRCTEREAACTIFVDEIGKMIGLLQEGLSHGGPPL